MHFFSLLFPWGVIVQAVALVHFIRRRPNGYWLWAILFLGPIGAFVYIAVEVIPDLGLLQVAVAGMNRRKKIAQLEGLVVENPAAGNYEELADAYLDEKNYARARECYDKAITPRLDHLDPLYRRGIAEIHLGDFAAAARDLELVTARDPKYDFNRAIALLAHACARTAQPEKAEALFQRALELSTLSETRLNYAKFLAAEGRNQEARSWAEKVLASKAAMPRYLQRRERPWFRAAQAMLKSIPK
jgi:hypothetical protein